MKAYDVIFYHSSDNQPGLLETVKGYNEAVQSMRQHTLGWETDKFGTLQKERGRIQYQANGWGKAVYIEEVN